MDLMFSRNLALLFSCSCRCPRLPGKPLPRSRQLDSPDNNALVFLDHYSAMVDDKGMLKRELSDDYTRIERGIKSWRPLAKRAIETALAGEQ